MLHLRKEMDYRIKIAIMNSTVEELVSSQSDDKVV